MEPVRIVRPTFIGITVVIVTISMGVAIWSFQKYPQRYNGSVKQVRVGTYLGEGSALVWIAEDLGYFKKNGLNVTVKEYEDPVLAAHDLIKGEIDIATLPEFAFVVQSFQEQDIRLIATITAADIYELIARRDHGIEEPSHLRKKRIGLRCKSQAGFFLARFLILNNLAPEEIEIVDLDPQASSKALLEGRVSAAFVPEPYVGSIKAHLGENAVHWPGQSDQNFCFLLTGTENLVRTDPELISHFLGAIVQAEELVNTNDYHGVQRIIARRLKVSKSYLESVWPKYTFAVSLEQRLLLAMEDEARWVIKNKLVDMAEIPNYLKFIYLDALESLRPEAVDIIR